MKEPATLEEWIEAGTLAHVYTMIHAARAYGLIEGGPDIDLERCESILEECTARDIDVSIDGQELKLLLASIVGGVGQ